MKLSANPAGNALARWRGLSVDLRVRSIPEDVPDFVTCLEAPFGAHGLHAGLRTCVELATHRRSEQAVNRVPMITSRLKRVGLVALAVVLIALVWMMNRARDVDLSPAEAVESPTTHSEDVAVELTQDQQDETNDARTAPVETSTARNATPNFEPPLDPTSHEKPAFAGSFVLERLDGTSDLHADGSFGIVYWREGAGIQQEVQVVDGVWRVLRIPSNVAIAPNVSVNWAKVGQRSLAVVAPREQQVPIDPLEIEVRVREVPSTMLNVVDSTTRANLGDVEIRVATERGLELVAGDARYTSPIDLVSLGLEIRTQMLQVRVPGYAYGRIDAVCGDGTERTVGLVPGGDLRVAIQRDVTMTGFDVSLTRAGEPIEAALRYEFDVKERMLVFESLEPGDYVVTARVGTPGSDPILLGETHARVQVGEVAYANLLVAPPPIVHRVDATGSLLVPSAWNLDAPVASIRMYSASSEEQESLDLEFTRVATEGDLDAFRCTLDDVIAGSYEFVLTHPPFIARFELTAEGPNDVRIVLPARGEVLVRLIDADTSERVRVPNVLWAQPIVEGQQSMASARVALDEALDGYRIHAFVGSIDVYLEDLDLFESLDSRVEVGLDARVVELRVRTPTIVEFALLDHGKLVPFPQGWEARIALLDGAELARVMSFGSAVRDYWLKGPGRYRFRFDEIPEYAPIADRVIDIPTRGRMRVEVELKARR